MKVLPSDSFHQEFFGKLLMMMEQNNVFQGGLLLPLEDNGGLNSLNDSNGRFGMGSFIRVSRYGYDDFDTIGDFDQSVSASKLPKLPTKDGPDLKSHGVQDVSTWMSQQRKRPTLFGLHSDSFSQKLLNASSDAESEKRDTFNGKQLVSRKISMAEPEQTERPRPSRKLSLPVRQSLSLPEMAEKASKITSSEVPKPPRKISNLLMQRGFFSKPVQVSSNEVDMFSSN